MLLLRHKGRRKRKFPLKAKNVSGVHVPAKKPKLPSSSSAAISKKKRTVPTVSLVKDVEAPTPGTSQSLVQAPAPASSRQMYSAELSELSSNMKRLSPEEMQEVLAIACPYVLDEDNEVDSGDDSDELRIDNLPGSCQWKIYDYVKDRISEKGMQAEPLGGSTYDNRNSDMPEEERAPAQVSPLPVLTKTKGLSLALATTLLLNQRTMGSCVINISILFEFQKLLKRNLLQVSNSKNRSLSHLPLHP